MAPNLEAIKNISSRLNPFRHRVDQDPTDDKSPQLTQTPTSTTNSPAGPAQAKKASEVSCHLPSTMNLKQGSSLSQSSKLPSTSGNMPPLPSAFPPFPSSQNALLVGDFASSGSSYQIGSTGKSPAVHNQMPTQELGTRYNPIDLTKPLLLGYDDDDDFEPSNTSIFTPPPPSWPSSFPINPLTPLTPLPPLPPSTPAAQGNTHLDSWMFVEPPPNTPAVPSDLAHFTPMPPSWWPPGPAHVAVHDYPQHTGFNGHMMNAEEPITGYFKASSSSFHQPQPERMIDIESPGASSESSGDVENPVEKATIDTVLAEIFPLQRFVQESVQRSCPRCPTNKIMDAKDVVNMTKGWAKTSGKIVLGAPCHSLFCPAYTCLGCGKAISTSTQESSSTLSISGTNITLHWCCDHGRLGAVWALACGWKLPTPKPRTVSRVVSKVRERNSVKLAATQAGHNPSWNPANAKGVGYGGGRPEYFPFASRHSRPTTRQVPKKPAENKEHTMHEVYFRLLAALLPSRNREDTLDVFPPIFFSAMLSRSPLLVMTAALLSNDSIEEVSRHHGLLNAMLDFFDALGDHPTTAGLVYGERNLYHAKGGGLFDISFLPIKNRSRIVLKDTSKPLVTLLEKLAAQSQTVLRHAGANPTEFQNPEGQDLLKISRRLTKVSAHHMANMQLHQTAMEISEEDSEVNFTEWHRENGVKDVPDEMAMKNFAYIRDVERIANMNANPTRGRMKRLITELSTLQTSLPEGIFIRHGSSRLDIMRILIIGPKHTPYEDGLFEFDLLCPLDYPNSPPRMKFRTTNGGRTRFNPNLYEDGTICLSLLGTWAGEPWRADQSTILQVLVSIQSMILCEHPWYNEPGRELTENKVLSTKYNNDVRSWTLQYALLPWISAIGAKVSDQDTTTNVTPFWQETARLYLQANAEDIVNSSKQAASKSKKSALQTAAKSVASTLQEKGYLA